MRSLKRTSNRIYTNNIIKNKNNDNKMIIKDIDNHIIQLKDTPLSIKYVPIQNRKQYKQTFIRTILRILNSEAHDTLLPRQIQLLDTICIQDFNDAIEIQDHDTLYQYLAIVTNDSIENINKEFDTSDSSYTSNTNIITSSSDNSTVNKYIDTCLSQDLINSIVKKDNMIVLQNLPLTYSINDIFNTFSTYGKILIVEIFRNQTKVFHAKNSFTNKVSPYFAHIYYNDKDSIDKVLTKNTERFGITIQRQAVYPIHSTKHTSLLLTNLQHDIGIYSLKDFLQKQTDGKITGINIRTITFKRDIQNCNKYAHIEFTTHNAADTVYRSLICNQIQAKKDLDEWKHNGGTFLTFSNKDLLQLNVMWLLCGPKQNTIDTKTIPSLFMVPYNNISLQANQSLLFTPNTASVIINQIKSGYNKYKKKQQYNNKEKKSLTVDENTTVTEEDVPVKISKENTIYAFS